jgi:hypothetical protein
MAILPLFSRNTLRPVWWGGVDSFVDTPDTLAKAVSDANHNLKVATHQYFRAIAKGDEKAIALWTEVLEQARTNVYYLEVC